MNTEYNTIPKIFICLKYEYMLYTYMYYTNVRLVRYILRHGRRTCRIIPDSI